MNAPRFSTLTLEASDAIATVWLDRPERANAMSAPMWDELERCFDWLDGTPEIRAVILAGRGRHFCSGIDLEMLASLRDEGEPGRRAERLRRRIRELQGNLDAVERCRKPVIAAVHGACLGGGLDLATCCDIRYCAPDARFAIREIDVGLVADVGTLQRLPYLVGEGVVRELAYTGCEIGAEEAAALRLVNRVYPDPAALLAGAREVAAVIASKSPLAVRGTKATLLFGRDHGVADSLDYAATWNGGMLSFADVEKAIAARGGGAEFED